MSQEVRSILLSKVLSAEGLFPNKYTITFNTLKSVILLEMREENKKQKLSDDLFRRFNDLEEQTLNLDEKVKGFPLSVVEQYFFRNSYNLDKYVYMEYKGIESQGVLKVIEIYQILEDFFSEVYNMAVEIADKYTYEIKLKTSKSQSNVDDIF